MNDRVMRGPVAPAARAAAAGLMVLTILGWPAPAAAQESGERHDMAAMMEAYEKAGTPGEHHRVLDRSVGEWDVEVRFYMDPGGEPDVSKGRAVIRWVMDGRYTREEVTGDFMGAPFRGLGFTGYNNVTGEYEATWIDNHTTQIYRYTGWAEDDGRMVFVSESKDPVTGEMVKSRSVSEFPSNDEMIVRGYEERGDGEVLTMELRYTRRN